MAKQIRSAAAVLKLDGEAPYRPTPWLTSWGRFSYGNPSIRGWDSDPHYVEIGSFCSIARGVVIQTGGNHRTDWVSSFPIRERLGLPGGGTDGHPTSNGDVTVGHDVWIGEGAMLLSGVSVGSGAAIAARSVVTTDVEPYTIVAGVPAKPVRKRFDDETIEYLLASEWWSWPRSVIENNVDLLCAAPGPELVALSSAVRDAWNGSSSGRQFHVGGDLFADESYDTVTSPEFAWNKVCVVIACYNHCAYVEEAIKSVVDQTFRDFTLVVTDDQSPGGDSALAKEILEGSDIGSWVVARRRENSGLPAILNDVLATTESPLLAFLGGDDLWEKDKLARQVEHIDRLPHVAAVASDAYRIGSANGRQFERYGFVPASGLAMPQIAARYPIAACTPLYRTSILRLAGGWDASLSYEDQYIMLELADFAQVEVTADLLASHRYHPGTSSKIHADRHLESRFHILERWWGRDPELDHAISKILSKMAMDAYRHGQDGLAESIVQKLKGRRISRTTHILRELMARKIGSDDAMARFALRADRFIERMTN